MTGAICVASGITGWRICDADRRETGDELMSIFRKRGRTAALVLSALMLVSAAAQASGTWRSFPANEVPTEQGYLVQEYTGTVRITFLGDCTLGCEEGIRGTYRSFVKTIERKGFAWPFRHLARGQPGGRAFGQGSAQGQ